MWHNSELTYNSTSNFETTCFIWPFAFLLEFLTCGCAAACGPPGLVGALLQEEEESEEGLVFSGRGRNGRRMVHVWSEIE
jgi:hypothetical protein